MTDGTNILHFDFDSVGAVSVQTGVIRNAQGDILGITNASGAVVVEYTYDAWGKLLSTLATTLGVLNPLRYRGYVYDTETGFYYLKSRYYNPVWGRFINTDAMVVDLPTIFIPPR